MKPPVQSFDMLTQVRFRIRGTREQIQTVHEFCWALSQEAQARGRRVVVQLGSSGPAGDAEGTGQWASAFWIDFGRAHEMRVFLMELGLKEET